MPARREDDVLVEVSDLHVDYALRGSFVQRLLGRDVGSVKAVDGVSFRLARGETIGLIGESGSGKSTLGRTILSLTTPTSGSVRFDGEPVHDLSPAGARALRRRMQMVFQDPHAALNPSMTLLEAVGHPLRIHGITRDADEIRRRVCEALERVELSPPERFLDKLPGDLSGGQKQRAVIARAIILGPQLVIADEPLSMLDMSVRAKVLQLMIDLKRELDLTYVYITHDLASARVFCDTIAIMYLGRIVEIGPAAEVFANPRHPYTVALLKAIPGVHADGRRGRRELPRGEVPDAAAPPAGCAFHPRCPRAFGPCGWEARDLRALLEARWAGMEPDAYRRERELLDGHAELGRAAQQVRLPAAAHALLAEQRAADPDEPLWSGVTELAREEDATSVRFHDAEAPLLQPVGGDGVRVACHLYGGARGRPADSS